jgi:hypothetical protein
MKVIITIFIFLLLARSVSASPSMVSYTATSNSSWSDGSGLNAFNITTTLRFTASYDCTTEGTTCHIGASQGTANLTVDYMVKILGLETNGSYLLAQVPTIVGDSSDIPLPIPPPPAASMVNISIHGHMIGEPTLDVGTANPSTLVWTSWGTRNTNVTAESTVLMLNTTYSFYMTITLIGLITQNSTTIDVQGIPIPIFPIPEFPTAPTLIIVLTLILLLFVVSSKFHSLPKLIATSK